MDCKHRSALPSGTRPACPSKITAHAVCREAVELGNARDGQTQKVARVLCREEVQSLQDCGSDSPKITSALLSVLYLTRCGRPDLRAARVPDRHTCGQFPQIEIGHNIGSEAAIDTGVGSSGRDVECSARELTHRRLLNGLVVRGGIATSSLQDGCVRVTLGAPHTRGAVWGGVELKHVREMG